MGDIVSFLVPHHGASSSSAAYYYAPDDYANDDADGGDDGYDDGYDDDGYDDPSMLFRAVGACMFLFGLGVGGEYPVSAVSAVSASERVMSSSSSLCRRAVHRCAHCKIASVPTLMAVRWSRSVAARGGVGGGG